jgi:hypothetical protein
MLLIDYTDHTVQIAHCLASHTLIVLTSNQANNFPHAFSAQSEINYNPF